MLQSGHGLYKKNYELITNERKPKDFENKALIYPVWDGEPAYEMMPTCWPVTDADSFHGTYMVRKRAYWSLFAGAFGYTYGHASVWCTATEKEKNSVCRFTWAEAIQSEGSKQMKILRDFMESYLLNDFVPCRERLLRQESEEDQLDLHEEALVNTKEQQMLVYFAADTNEEIDVDGIFDADKVFTGWFDPANGQLTEIREVDILRKDNKNMIEIRNDSPNGEDRILIMAADPSEIRTTPGTYFSEDKEEMVHKVFEW